MASLSLDLGGRGKKKPWLPVPIIKWISRCLPIPIWGIGLGMVGCLALGTAFGSRRSMTPAVAPAPTLPLATDVNTTSPSSALSSSVVSPTISTTTPPVAPTTAPVPSDGPSFDQLYASITSATKEQREAYWKTVAKTKVSWRGDFVQLGASPSGPLLLRCKSGSDSFLVTITLSASPPQTLPPMQPNQSIPVEGILESYSEQGYQLVEGKVIG